VAVRNLLIQMGSERFSAVLHEDRAPKTCNSIIERLPINGKIIHARWSGEAMWLTLANQPINLDYENQTCYPSKGELLFYPGFVSEKELLIPYGSSRFASRSGVLAGNHFATISEGLDRLAKVGKSVLWEGAKDISIRVS